MPAYDYVDRPDRILSDIEASDPVGVDTEFMRERTFLSQLCLVQISTSDKIFCVDPLAESDFDAFWHALAARTWVLHSARQDIEVVFQSTKTMPSKIFDTQIAAGLLGYQAQIGYAGLIETLFDTRLPKSHTRANWAKRPLSSEYLDYAAEDVEYLLPAYEALAEQLSSKGRLQWAIADSQLLLDPTLYEIDPGKAIARLKGARNLRGRRRSIAARLAEWRESEALRLDRPRQWILRDSVLIDIAFKTPTTAKELGRIEDLPEKVAKRSGKDLLAAVADAANDANDYRPPGPPDESQKNLLRRMQELVAECAADLDIPAETIASKKELSAVIIDGQRDSRVLSGWRKDLIGDQLAALL